MGVRAPSRIRKKYGLYSYKLGKNKHHKNPHAIPLKHYRHMKAEGYNGQLKINERNRLSDRPFGRVTSKGRFVFDVEKVPFYNVPDLTDFKLKPYVPHITPKISADKKVERLVESDDGMQQEIDQAIENASRGMLQPVSSAEKMDRQSGRGR